MIATFAARLLAGEECTILGDGEQTRDFLYVDDCVDAFVRAAEQGDGLVINVGTGVETSVNDLYVAMAGATGVDRRPARQRRMPAKCSARRSTPAGPPSARLAAVDAGGGGRRPGARVARRAGLNPAAALAEQVLVGGAHDLAAHLAQPPGRVRPGRRPRECRPTCP